MAGYLASQLGIEHDGAIHCHIGFVDHLDLHPVDFGMLVPNHSATYGCQFLLGAPVATHVNKLAVGVEYGFKALSILGSHHVPDFLRQVGKWLLLGGVGFVVVGRETHSLSH